MNESLEQQTATSEILRVIASSPTDLQPVMEAIAENAARVCGATDASIFRLEGEHLRSGGATRIAAPWIPGDRRHHPGRSRHHSRTGCTRPADDPRRGHRDSRAGVPDNRVPLEAGRGLHPDNLGDTAAARRYTAGRHLHQSGARGPAVLGQADRAPRDVCQPGRHRHRERPAVQGIGGPQSRGDRGAGAADRDWRDPRGDQRSPTDIQPIFDVMCRSAVRLCEASSAPWPCPTEAPSLRAWHGFEASDLDAIEAASRCRSRSRPLGRGRSDGGHVPGPRHGQSYRAFARERGLS